MTNRKPRYDLNGRFRAGSGHSFGKNGRLPGLTLTEAARSAATGLVGAIRGMERRVRGRA